MPKKVEEGKKNTFSFSKFVLPPSETFQVLLSFPSLCPDASECPRGGMGLRKGSKIKIRMSQVLMLTRQEL